MMEKTFSQRVFVAVLCLLMGLQLQAFGQSYNLKISKIDAKKTPQSGDWRAGVIVRQVSDPDNQDSWHGGEGKFEGADASLPVKLELSGLASAERIQLFVGLDDDAEDAGNESKSEDKAYVDFKVYPSGTKEKSYAYSTGEWSLVIHYTLTK